MAYTRPVDEGLGIWPENWQPLHVFMDMMTQWAAGPDRVLGLRYEALGLVLDLHAIEPAQRREVFDTVRVLENEAVSRMNTSK